MKLPLYARRVIGSAAIKPITQSNWYQPRALVAGSKNVVDLEVVNSNPPWIDQGVLEGVDRYLMQQNSSAVLIMHRGQLVHAKYRNFRKDYTFNSMSLVKTIQAMAIGIAIDQGLIKGVKDPVSDYLPEWKNDRRGAITVEHLLCMQSGLKSDLKPHGISLFPSVVPLYLGTNIQKQVLSLPAVAEPGEYFEYNNYNTQLLGMILERVSGMSAAEFFSKYIWEPIECHDAALWLDKEGGSARTFGTMLARPEDWLRVAQLFLTQGRYKDRQIVPAAWLQQMIVPRNTVERGVKGGRADYGYQIWLKAHDYGLLRGIPWFEATHAKEAHADAGTIYFEGMRGQFLFISPRHQLMLLRVGERPRRNWDNSWAINQLVRSLDSQQAQA